MTNETVAQFTKQAETLFAAPARSFAGMAIEHFEKLVSAQFEAAKTYSDTGLQQARAALEVKSATDLQGYVENQQKLAKELSERVKSDAEKLVALNEEFARNAQKLVQSSVQATTKAAQGK